MRKTIFFALLMLVSTLTFAQRTKNQLLPTPKATSMNHAVKGIAKSSNQSKAAKIRKAEGDELVLPPTGVAVENWEYLSGSFMVYDNDWMNFTSQANMDYDVVVDGNDIYVRGLAFYFQDSWVKGTIDGNKVTIPAGQFVGEDEYGPEYINGQDWTTDELIDIVFDYDAEAKTLTLDSNIGIMEADGKNSLNCYCYWQELKIGIATPEDLTLTTPPDGLSTTLKPISVKDREAGETFEYEVTVGFVGNDVYFQGLVPAKQDAWVKGTLNENEVSIPMQYIGQIEGTDYFFGGLENGSLQPGRLAYYAESNEFESIGILVVNGSTKRFTTETMLTNYTGLFIGTRPEAILPPEGIATEKLKFTGFDLEQNKISDYVNVGIVGNDVYIQGLVAYAQDAWIKGTISADKTMVSIPSSQFVGIEEESGLSMYLTSINGDESNYTLDDVKFNYNAVFNTFELVNDIYINGLADRLLYYDMLLAGLTIGVEPDASWVANAQEYENAQSVTNITFSEGLTGTLQQNESNNEPKYYSTGEALRMYAQNSLTITSSDKEISKIVFILTGNENQMKLEADKGEYVFAGNKGVWTGLENTITFTVPAGTGNQARIQRIDIYYADYGSMIVEAPEDLVTESYYFKGFDTYFETDETKEVAVGFYGEDNKEVYIQGLSYFLPEAWVKGKLDDAGNLTIHGWYLGLFESAMGSADIVFSEATFHYDEATNTFTTAEYKTLNKADDGPMDEYTNVVIKKIIERAATPADPTINDYIQSSSYDYVKMNIPMEDTDGEPMLSSKMTYQLYVDVNGTVSELVFRADDYEELTSDMTIIPYNFTDDWDIYKHGSKIFLNHAERSTWNKIGVQSTYNGGGESHSSAVVWYTITDETSIDDNVTAEKEGDNIIYNMQGMRVDNAKQKGIYIKNGRKFIVK